MRSVYMDSWSHAQILTMLEGGNDQLNTFFRRHSLAGRTSSSSYNHDNPSLDAVVERRYKTKAAQFYRDQLVVHVHKVIGRGTYQGREAARRGRTQQRSPPKRRSKSERTVPERGPSSGGPGGVVDVVLARHRQFVDDSYGSSSSSSRCPKKKTSPRLSVRKDVSFVLGS